MGKIIKKYKKGDAVKYCTRAKALKLLQLSLRDFRRLCILKGIYPRVPRHRRQAQHGSMEIKTLFSREDIKFLMNEPIVNAFRQNKAHLRKMTRAYARQEMSKFHRLRNMRPTFRLDHIIRERYPTFEDALNDLDDCLSLLFLFATFPKSPVTSQRLIDISKRVTTEFLIYVIEARALRKVFASIKGFYFQVHIKGRKILWVAPHLFSFKRCQNADYKIMSTFAEIYSVLLGFINFKLYHSINLKYPPKLTKFIDVDDKETIVDLLSSLNTKVARIGQAEEEPEGDEFPEMAEESEQAKAIMEETAHGAKVTVLFSGLKFFLNREIPREYLVFMIRACGGEVSWDPTVHHGATFPETDESITHQITDRENQEKTYMSRHYVQPQWIFDSINVGVLLPVQKYFIGAILPPHLSPFAYEGPGAYIPPEKKAQIAFKKGQTLEEQPSTSKEDEAEEEDEEMVIEGLEDLDDSLGQDDSISGVIDGPLVDDSDDDEDDGEEASADIWKFEGIGEDEASEEEEEEESKVVEQRQPQRKIKPQMKSSTDENTLKTVESKVEKEGKKKKEVKKLKKKKTPEVTDPVERKKMQQEKHRASMSVEKGEFFNPDTAKIQKAEDEMLNSLAVGLMSKKQKRVYNRMKRSRTIRHLASEKLAMKRAEIEGQLEKGTTDAAFRKGKRGSKLYKEKMKEISVRNKPTDFSKLPKSRNKRTVKT